MAAKIARPLSSSLGKAGQLSSPAAGVIAPPRKVERPALKESRFDAKPSVVAKPSEAEVALHQRAELCLNFGPAGDVLMISGSNASELSERAPDFAAVANLKVKFEGDLAEAK